MRLTTFLGLALLALAAACGKSDILDQQAAALGKFPEGKILALSGEVSERAYNGDLVWRAMRPGFVRVRLSLGPDQIYEEGYDGKKSWEKPIANTKPYETSGPAQEALKRGAMWLGHYRPLKEMTKLGATIDKLEPESLDGVMFDRVQVTVPDGDSRTFYLDRTTHLVVRVRTHRALHAGAGEAPQEIETVLEDWRKIGNLNVAFKMTEREAATGKVLQTTQWRQAIWEPGDKRLFAMPKG